MVTEPPLTGDDAEHLVTLPARLRRSRLATQEWAVVAAALARLHGKLVSGASNRDVLRALYALDDMLEVRVRTEPGGLASAEPPDDVAHLVHEVEMAARERTQGVPATDQ
ncbi:hypothetical protein JOF56_006483 [Kibdelosporangium banguiense]|uniref:Uncharacterized protein n=1 Tax=Kibdelosporangium banguiense TaxID=1365924 RepID=A0ABS4TNW6_9PSEU|nr:hypothetical protein [Kibdelosporangium banguiense]MBP2326098.1 hypothetical protein [Kibdelosporangium banguiense]